ncbi:MAG: Antibiotic biosynthesis monooxygenase [Rhodoglobus sp.]|nr:Antibiotic biosynthesis monooxygenase [Rhodoglobus sp.]
MTAPAIEHIGILVPDLEEAIERWSAATGYTFSPIARYRTSRYADHSNPEPHDHDARISFSREGQPRIELMEVSGDGTHSAAQAGVHHLGFRGIESPEDRIAELAAQGVGVDGISYDAEGRILLCFTEKTALDGVRLELISSLPGPVVADDGSTLPTDPETGRPDMWAGAR